MHVAATQQPKQKSLPANLLHNGRNAAFFAALVQVSHVSTQLQGRNRVFGRGLWCNHAKSWVPCIFNMLASYLGEKGIHLPGS